MERNLIILIIVSLLVIVGLGMDVFIYQKISQIGVLVGGGGTGETEKICGSLPLVELETGGGGEDSLFQGQDYCYLAFSQQNKNTELCGKIRSSSIQTTCYSSLALKMADLSVCDKIKKNDFKEDCLRIYASEMGDSSICERMTTYRKDDCFSMFASRDRNAALCEKITDPQRKSDCQGMFKPAEQRVTQPPKY